MLLCHVANGARLASLFLLGSSSCARAASPQPQKVAAKQAVSSQALDSSAVRRFVQEFYDWYMPLARKGDRSPTYWSVLTASPRFLRPEIASALREDSAARFARPMQREYLNYDPFLDSQDPCDGYEITRLWRSGASYNVTVRQRCSPPGYQKQQPTVVVTREDGVWRISNVVYDRGGDLMSELCHFAMADDRPNKRPARCR
jgi:hypothetical protein